MESLIAEILLCFKTLRSGALELLLEKMLVDEVNESKDESEDREIATDSVDSSH